jgi:hypothetical protein
MLIHTFCVALNPPDDGQLGRNMLRREPTHSYGLMLVLQLTVPGTCIQLIPSLNAGWETGYSH